MLAQAVGVLIGSALGLWAGLRFDGPADMARRALRRIRRVRTWPRPALVTHGAPMTVCGERWPSYIPPEPMTDASASSAHEYRERAARDESWRRMVEGARNRLGLG